MTETEKPKRRFTDPETGEEYERVPAGEFDSKDEVDSTTVPTHPDDPE